MDFSVLEKCFEYFREENDLREQHFRDLVVKAINQNPRLGRNPDARCQFIQPKYEQFEGIEPPLKFTRDTLGNLKDGADFRHVIALLTLCATDPDFEESLRHIEADANLSDTTLWEIYKEYEIKAKLELGLLVRPTLRSAEQPYGPQDAILHYAYDDTDKIEVLGRAKEQDELRDFLTDDRKFLWVQLAGAAGQGKSRLAWDLIQEQRSKEEEGFDAGYMRGEDLEEFIDGWAVWQPHKPTLIVIDCLTSAVMGPNRVIC